MGGVCCREQARVPEHMYVTLFVQALQPHNWNHMDIDIYIYIGGDSPLRLPQKLGPPLSQKKCFADILFKIHARMNPSRIQR